MGSTPTPGTSPWRRPAGRLSRRPRTEAEAVRILQFATPIAVGRRAGRRGQAGRACKAHIRSDGIYLAVPQSMEQQLPIALQVFLYAGSMAIIALSAMLVVILIQLRGHLERMVRSVEELKGDIGPLAREARVMVEGIRLLSSRVEGQWGHVENMVGRARAWSERANHLVEEVGSMVEPPLLSASRNVRMFRSGLWAFLRALSGRPQNGAHQKARAS